MNETVFLVCIAVILIACGIFIGIAIADRTWVRARASKVKHVHMPAPAWMHTDAVYDYTKSPGLPPGEYNATIEATGGRFEDETKPMRTKNIKLRVVP